MHTKAINLFLNVKAALKLLHCTPVYFLTKCTLISFPYSHDFRHKETVHRREAGKRDGIVGVGNRRLVWGFIRWIGLVRDPSQTYCFFFKNLTNAVLFGTCTPFALVLLRFLSVNLISQSVVSPCFCGISVGEHNVSPSRCAGPICNTPKNTQQGDITFW